MTNIDFQDPRIEFNRYYYLDGETLQSVSRDKVELGVTYFAITTKLIKGNDPIFRFGTFKDISGYYRFNPIIESTDWNYYPYFIKSNVIEKLKELVNV